MTARMVCMVLAITALLAGCGGTREQKLTPPRTLVAPYDTSRGEVLWAVVPLRNESGTSVVDVGAMSDKLVAAVEQVQGVRCLPLNRTIQAMNVLGYATLRTPAEARSLAQAMGVDGVLVGSITAYDPYVPTIGMSVALYSRPGAMAQGRQPLDPRTLTVRARDTEPGMWPREEGPVAVVSEHLDAKNHQVLMDVRSYAEGRDKQPSALGWRRYTASAHLFAEFAAYHVVDTLIKQEWTRLPGSVPGAAPGRTAGAGR